MKVLVVVDMQNDFIDGALGSSEAQKIVPNVINAVKNFDGLVLFTQDTHFENYLQTQEGKKLPVKHCIKGTFGWQIASELDKLRKTAPIEKNTFGSKEMIEVLKGIKELESITFMGLCTDICVISCAMLAKAYFTEIPIIVDASCCAGVTKDSHLTALNALKSCQIEVINE